MSELAAAEALGAFWLSQAHYIDVTAEEVPELALEAVRFMRSLPVAERMEAMGMAPWSSNSNDHLHVSARQYPPLWQEVSRG